MAKDAGLGLLMLGGAPKGGAAPEPDDDDDLDEGIDEMGAYDDGADDPDEPSVEFTLYAEQALGTKDPLKVKALRDAVRAELGGGDMGPPLPDEPLDDEGIV